MFPKDFTWGAATASFQIEGARTADGKGRSVWDDFVERPGVILDGTRADVAAASYERWHEDVDLLDGLGAGAYRLSLSWPRIIPDGDGPVNERGLSYYDRLVDALLEKGVEPWVTLFHWDFPLDLFDRGGWLNRESVGWFTDYTARVVERLGDRVGHWMTMNEPQCFIGLGHVEAKHAPGIHFPMRHTVRMAHHAMMAHGEAVRVIRAQAKRAPSIGWAPVGVVAYPHTETEADIEAARTVMFGASDDPGKWCWTNTWFSDPVLLGTYPQGEEWSVTLAALGGFPSGDLDMMRAPLDFYGCNTYTGSAWRAGPGGAPERVLRRPGDPVTSYGWAVTPPVLYWGPRFYAERYGLPVVITENGCAVTEWPDETGSINDVQRIDYVRRHLGELRRAIADGVDVRGYFHWSLMDNFEWQHGYTKTFGLVHVDPNTGERTPKASYEWYRGVIGANGATIQGDASARGPQAGVPSGGARSAKIDVEK